MSLQRRAHSCWLAGGGRAIERAMTLRAVLKMSEKEDLGKDENLGVQKDIEKKKKKKKKTSPNALPLREFPSWVKRAY